MRKKITAPLLVIVALLLVFGQVGFAQDMEGKFGIGAGVAYVTLQAFQYDDGFDPDENVMYGGNLTYFIQKVSLFRIEC